MSKFEVGDMVNAYWTAGKPERCEVTKIFSATCFELLSIGTKQKVYAHPKQCRKLIPRKKGKKGKLITREMLFSAWHKHVQNQTLRGWNECYQDFCRELGL